MKTITVEVTQGDIEADKKKPLVVGRRCATCPVALAMGRALGREAFVNGSEWGFVVAGGNYGPIEGVVSDKVSMFIARADNGRSLSPFTFTIEVPE